MQPEDSLAGIETKDLNLGCIPYYHSFNFFLFEIITTNVLIGGLHLCCPHTSYVVFCNTILKSSYLGNDVYVIIDRYSYIGCGYALLQFS